MSSEKGSVSSASLGLALSGKTLSGDNTQRTEDPNLYMVAVQRLQTL